MLDTGLVSHNISNYSRFKSADDVIKTEWQESRWNRRQVRVHVEPTGELTVQTIVQNNFVKLANSFLKFVSCGHVKSFGKNVVSCINAEYSLPENIAVLMSPQKQQEMLEIQCNKLAPIILPYQNKLANLSDELVEYALGRTTNEKVFTKILEMNEEILAMQYPIIQLFEEDLEPEQFYAELQKYEIHARLMLEQLPKKLEKFIDECLAEEAKEAAKPSDPESVGK